jgi:hypothetical protein
MREIHMVMVTGTMSGAAKESPSARRLRGRGRVTKRTVLKMLLYRRLDRNANPS